MLIHTSVIQFILISFIMVCQKLEQYHIALPPTRQEPTWRYLYWRRGTLYGSKGMPVKVITQNMSPLQRFLVFSCKSRHKSASLCQLLPTTRQEPTWRYLRWRRGTMFGSKGKTVKVIIHNLFPLQRSRVFSCRSGHNYCVMCGIGKRYNL